MAGLHETKYMRIFPIQEIDQNLEAATGGKKEREGEREGEESIA